MVSQLYEHTTSQLYSWQYWNFILCELYLNNNDTTQQTVKHCWGTSTKFRKKSLFQGGGVLRQGLMEPRLAQNSLCSEDNLELLTLLLQPPSASSRTKILTPSVATVQNLETMQWYIENTWKHAVISYTASWQAKFPQINRKFNTSNSETISLAHLEMINENNEFTKYY